MLNSTVLEVVVGLVFIFLMLSVACSLLNERIQSLLEKRARMLEVAIRKLLVGDELAATPEASGLFHGVIQHALVRAIAHSPSHLPSYLPSSTFALALFDTLCPADGTQPLTFKRLRDAIAVLPVSAGRTSLLALLNAAEYDLPAARAAVERWFDGAMDRLSGAYKRHINGWIFALGFGLAAAVNADAIQLVQRMEHEDALRARVVAQATKAGQDGTELPRDTTQLDTTDLLFWDTTKLVSANEVAHYPRAARTPELTQSWFVWLWLKIIGFAMTGLAVTLGAPFWFDLLGRLVNLRATGAKPAKAPVADA
ncbi:MAG: hypothetical protein ABIY55_12005 [Kofleriaceae bacterium]